MTAKEYFKQAYLLDQRIDCDLKEVASLRGMAEAITSMRQNDPVQTSRKREASFVHTLEKVIDMEERIKREIDTLISLKNEIRAVINTVEDETERTVLQYRYINNYKWQRIGRELNADSRTVRRWHESALRHVVLPKNHVIL